MKPALYLYQTIISAFIQPAQLPEHEPPKEHQPHE